MIKAQSLVFPIKEHTANNQTHSTQFLVNSVYQVVVFSILQQL